ncbi:hypothetical protein GA0115261_100011, partial [Streptomyces sp. OspMP-M43]
MRDNDHRAAVAPARLRDRRVRETIGTACPRPRAPVG